VAIEKNTSIEYHDRCVKRLFGTRYVPKIRFSYSDIPNEAMKTIGKMSISGLQIKLPIKIDKQKKEMIVDANESSHILKPTPEIYPYLSENENLCMNLARKFLLDAPHRFSPHGLVRLNDGKLAYLIKRFDRDFEGKNHHKIHVEDFMQLLGKEDKYAGSIEQIWKFIKTTRGMEFPYGDSLKLYLRVVFNFLIGNADAHLKNFSLIKYDAEGYRLAPCYDLVCTALVLPKVSDEMALSINGKRNKIKLEDFISLGNYMEIDEKRRKDLLFRKFEFFYKSSSLNEKENLVENCLLPSKMKDDFKKLFAKRYDEIFPIPDPPDLRISNGSKLME
jgi:serine/threonine-protein kinase HipA